MGHHLVDLDKNIMLSTHTFLFSFLGFDPIRWTFAKSWALNPNFSRQTLSNLNHPTEHSIQLLSPSLHVDFPYLTLVSWWQFHQLSKGAILLNISMAYLRDVTTAVPWLFGTYPNPSAKPFYRVPSRIAAWCRCSVVSICWTSCSAM